MMEALQVDGGERHPEVLNGTIPAASCMRTPEHPTKHDACSALHYIHYLPKHQTMYEWYVPTYSSIMLAMQAQRGRCCTAAASS